MNTKPGYTKQPAHKRNNKKYGYRTKTYTHNEHEKRQTNKDSTVKKNLKPKQSIETEHLKGNSR